jgi:tetratricopeptide (TPR) repeat protein
MRELLNAGRFQEVLAEFRRLESRHVPADVFLTAATAATRVGDLEVATTLAESALDRFRVRADDDGRIRSLNLLGVIAYEKGKLHEAQQCFSETLRLARDLRDTMMVARSSNNLASVAYLQGDTRESLTLFRSALLSYQRLGDRRGTAESYHNLGIIFREMEEWKDAETASAEAVRHAELVGERSLVGVAVTGRAEVSLSQGEFSMARQELGLAGRLAREASDELGIVEVGRVRALLSHQEGDFEAAALEADQARSSAEQLHAAVLQAECAAVAARALRALGRNSLAEVRRAEAIRLFQAQGAARRLEQFEAAWGK